MPERRAAPRGRRAWPHNPSTEDQQMTLQLQKLLQQSQNGEIKGLIVAVHYGAQDFGFAGSGSFCKQPALVHTVLAHFRNKFIVPFIQKAKS